MTQLRGKNIQDDAIDSNHYIDGSIDGVHLSDDARDNVISYAGNKVARIRSTDTISSGTGSTLGNSSLDELVIYSSLKGLIGGSPSTDGIIISPPANICQIRSSENEAIIDGNDQVYGRFTAVTNPVGGTSTWDGTTTVLMTDTTGINTGDFVASTSTGIFFKVVTVNINTSVVIENPKSFTIPSSGTSSFLLVLGLDYYIKPAGVETSYGGFSSGAVDILIIIPESCSIKDWPFQALDEFGAFPEIIDKEIDATEVEFDPSGLTNTASTDVDGVLSDYDAAIDSVAASVTATVVESLTAEVITGTDTPLADTLSATPVAGSFQLWFDGILMDEGAGKDYTRSGDTITWLASSGTAPDMALDDTIDVRFNT